MQKKIKDLFGLKMKFCFFVNYFKLCGTTETPQWKKDWRENGTNLL